MSDEIGEAVVTGRFDYTTLPADIRAEASAAADEIRRRMRGAIIEAGTALIPIKDRLPHGQFGKWLGAEFGMTERTAQNYMSAASLALKCETVSVLKPRTLYQLAAPSIPDQVRDDVIARFNAGEHVLDAEVVKAISAVKYEQRQKLMRLKCGRTKKRAPTDKAEAERRAQLVAERADRQRKAMIEVLDVIREAVGLERLRGLVKAAGGYVTITEHALAGRELGAG